MKDDDMTNEAAIPAAPELTLDAAPTAALASDASETPALEETNEKSATALASLAAPALVPLGVAEPRTRWAGIIWGLLLAAIAGGGLMFVLTNGSANLTSWVMTFTPFTLGIYAVLVLAALAVVTALVALVRHAQKTFAARRARL